MNFADGRDIRVGDIVALGESLHGVVACSITDGAYTPDHFEESWTWLGQGFVVEFPTFGLIHYEQADPNLRLVVRASA